MQPQNVQMHFQDLKTSTTAVRQEYKIGIWSPDGKIRLLSPRRIAKIWSNYSFHICGSVQNIKALRIPQIMTGIKSTRFDVAIYNKELDISMHLWLYNHSYWVVNSV